MPSASPTLADVGAGITSLGALFGVIGVFLKLSKTNGSNETRLSAVEVKQGEMATELKKLSDISTELAVMSAEFRGFRELVARDTEEIRHNTRGVKTGQEKLSDLVSQLLAKRFGDK